jgi:hypothetical protein
MHLALIALAIDIIVGSDRIITHIEVRPAS